MVCVIVSIHHNVLLFVDRQRRLYRPSDERSKHDNPKMLASRVQKKWLEIASSDTFQVSSIQAYDKFPILIPYFWLKDPSRIFTFNLDLFEMS
jgi:hypothetical protein